MLKCAYPKTRPILTPWFRKLSLHVFERKQPRTTVGMASDTKIKDQLRRASVSSPCCHLGAFIVSSIHRGSDGSSIAIPMLANVIDPAANTTCDSSLTHLGARLEAPLHRYRGLTPLSITVDE